MEQDERYRCIESSPESWNKPSGGIFVFHYLFRRGKPWYTENDNPEFEEIES